MCRYIQGIDGCQGASKAVARDIDILNALLLFN